MVKQKSESFRTFWDLSGFSVQTAGPHFIQRTTFLFFFVGFAGSAPCCHWPEKAERANKTKTEHPNKTQAKKEVRQTKKKHANNIQQKQHLPSHARTVVCFKEGIPSKFKVPISLKLKLAVPTTRYYLLPPTHDPLPTTYYQPTTTY